ncbi:MarR family winged helix-turn-helix transcriptional regulator [Enterococcus sp. HY326]|uniref:MarR family winged helix-turn-helix transcriptional regulator n=1 Tax=Enterococcus sp. HY326 TaxID=2971265 RepID=UPI00223F7865|nr:MarR family winged helix-turn-helix transcriptional regulator [Enterococcus sp. HY326]
MNDLSSALKNLQCELVAERNIRNPQNITWLQYDILNALSNGKEELPSEISILLGISRAKLSKALKELKAMHYVQQKPSEKDGRELVTFLTEEGNQLLVDIGKGHSQLEQVANVVFDAEEKEIFKQLAEKYLQGLRSERKQEHD